jgi:ankyrin repeat protein
MKHLLLTTIAAVVLVGCGEAPLPERIDRLNTAKAPDISIHVAAGRGNIKTIKQHIAAGTDANAKDDYEQTPLHMAALHGEEEVAELLIAEGADVNAQRDGGGTPLDLAYTRPELANLLRKHGGKTGEELKAEGK